MDKVAPALRKLVLAIALFLLPAPTLAATSADMARWRAQAARVTITRDNWGIAHVRGRRDADAVFGAIYAQAEDDFSRIEANWNRSDLTRELTYLLQAVMKGLISPTDMVRQTQDRLENQLSKLSNLITAKEEFAKPTWCL